MVFVVVVVVVVVAAVVVVVYLLLFLGPAQFLFSPKYYTKIMLKI